MSYEWIIFEKDEGIATITLNRTDRLNSLIPPMRVEMRTALEDLGADDGVRVMILTGAGRAFCAGADVVTFAERTEMADDEPLRELRLQPVATPRLLEIMRNMDKPSICALNGVAAGAGTALALTCDIIVASDQARFRIAFTRMGTIPADGVSYLLSRRIGIHRALELAYTNDIIDAKEMDRIGLVNKVVPHDDLMKETREMAKKMFQIAPLTLAHTKKSIYRGVAAPGAEQAMEYDHLLAKTLAETEDQQEAARSFIEKRTPQYKGK
jgi:enoyl-CoA hydratase/carnithine racemase